MWLFTKYGFFSVVEAEANQLVIRARQKRHLRELLARFDMHDPIIVTPKGDYPYRVVLTKSEVAYVMSELAKEIDYPNFKEEIHKKEGPTIYEQILHQIWALTRRMQSVQKDSGYRPDSTRLGSPRE